MNPGDGQPMDTDQPCQPDSGVDTSDNDKKHYMVVIGYMLTHAGLFNIFFGAMSVYMTSLPYNFEWFLQVLCGVPVSYNLLAMYAVLDLRHKLNKPQPLYPNSQNFSSFVL